MEAAFFDLDKTVIARPSMMAFAGPFCRAGLLKRRTLAKGAWIQLVYVRFGAGPTKLARIQKSVLAVTAGWQQDQVRQIVADHLVDRIDPITYREAADLIALHRQAGRHVYLVSAAPEEVVEPIGRHLGVDTTIASRADIDDDGRYTGALERYAYGMTKVALMTDAAARDGIDLAASWSYSDSATDAPMLEVVGHAMAVNPDRALRALARQRGWEIVRFSQMGAAAERSATGASAVEAPVPSIPEVAASGWRRHWRTVTLASTAAVMTTTGGVTAWLWHRKVHLRHA